MEYLQYIHAELLVLIPVLYLVGMALKASRLEDHWIPLVLGITSIVLCGLWVFASTSVSNMAECALAVFSAITQGILAAGASVYANQIYKQLKEKNNT